MCLAIPGQIVELVDHEPLTRRGVVNFSGVRKAVNLTFVPEAAVGDFILVHVGFAIARIDAQEAERVFSYLRELGELDDLNGNSDRSDDGVSSGSAPKDRT
ncbi:MAG: HypC/HybG/HupF family hydrogenase formation chaperone [Proteobacteria bacterium]|nr:HypC/HybG/HupF family hydrogenase formation chaperone [Pseudomonadota bacterium]